MINISEITCFGATQQLGIAQENLLFSWKINADHRNVLQHSYQLQLAGDEQFNEIHYDSGRVISSQSINVGIGDFIPVSRTRYYFRVRVIDTQSIQSPWSPTGWCETALLRNHEWHAQWITPVIQRKESVALLRRSFFLNKPVKSARLYSTALGIYQLWLNGKRVSDALFSPGWTSYDNHLQYQIWDLTALLQPGDNVLGVALAEGWFKGELTWLEKRQCYGDKTAFLAQLHICFDDDQHAMLRSDGDWQCGEGAITQSGFYSGESWDARRDDQHGLQPGKPEDWQQVSVIDRHYTLIPQVCEPVRVTERRYPHDILRQEKGGIIVDMGQNMVGRMRLRATLAMGAVVTLRHAEVLTSSGEFYTKNLRNAHQTVRITGNGQAIDYAAEFSFQGFRYVEVTGLDHMDDTDLSRALSGEVLHSDMARTGYFSCNNPDINQLFNNIIWGQRGNFVDIPTDCPQRDERLGWTGDAHIFIRTAAYNYNVHRFFRKWLMSVAADQKSNGTVPMVIPDVLRSYISKMWGDETYTSSGWGDAVVICPWTLWQVYGDKQLLAEQYPSMVAWVNYIHQTGDDPWLWDSGFQFGDWLALDAEPDSYFGATPVFLVASAFYAWSTLLLARSAHALGFEHDAKRYQQWFDNIRTRFCQVFMQDGKMISDTQTAHILPLAFGLLPDETRQDIADRLNALVIENGYHLTTGFIGTPWLCTALSENGHHHTAVRLACQTGYPSWLFSVKQGATTIWEHWDGIKPDGSFWSENMNSFNHYAYGAIGEWFYRFIAGIDYDERSIAWNKIIFRPDLSAAGFSSASARYHSVRGEIAIEWRLQGNQAQIWLSIPANAVATVKLPPIEEGSLIEHRHGENISAISTPQGSEVALGSGKYHLTMTVLRAEARLPVSLS